MKFLKAQASAKRTDYFQNKLYSTAAWKRFRLSILREQGGKCVACGNVYADKHLQIDHITPIRNGGAVYDMANLQVLCIQCHGSKTNSEVLHGGGLKSNSKRHEIRTPIDNILLK